jgi:hypothetical protein
MALQKLVTRRLRIIAYWLGASAAFWLSTLRLHAAINETNINPMS